MTFTARLVRGSPIWRLWTDHHRTGGIVAGIRFQWTAGGDFATGELMPHQVGPLLGLADVRVEMITNAPLPVSMTAVPEQQPESPSTAPEQRPVQQATVPAQQPVQQTMVPAQQPVQQTTVPAQQPVQQTTVPVPPSLERSTLRLPDHQQYRSKGHRR